MPWTRLHSWLCSLLLVLCIFLNQCGAQLDRIVIECGGFVRWNAAFTGSAKINYNKLKVNLIAESSGALKEVTEILPNGAFSVPVYDLNVYRIMLTSPKGWIVTPASGYLINLQADPKTCSKDFDFILNGFTVYGQVVTYGLNHGPPGLGVRLIASKPDEIIQHNTTEQDGHFRLAPVLPGTYELIVSESDANETNHARAHVTVTVGVDSVTLRQPVMLMGHFVRGTVTGFDHRALPGTLVYLGTNASAEEMSTVQCDRVDHLPEAAAAVMPTKMGNGIRWFCQSRTNSKGLFSFDGLPGGEYVLLPYHVTSTNGHLSFDPPILPVTMAHKDIFLGNSTFRAQRIRISPGRVMWPDGRPIESVRVYVNKDTSHSVLTDRSGYYQLGFLEPGRILIQVEAEHALFHPFEFHLAVDSDRLPEIRPHRLSVCGRIELSDDFDRTLKPRVLVHENRTGERLPDVKDVEPAGSRGWRFCTDLAPGHYTLTPDLSTADPTAQVVHVVPATMQVHLQSGPVSDLVFSQFRAKLSGRLRCLDTVTCVPLSGVPDRFPFVVRLRRSKDSDVALVSSPVRPSKDNKHIGHFVIDHVLPGDYYLDLLYSPDANVPPEPLDGWCWKPWTDTTTPHAIFNSTRRLRVHQADLSWTHDPVLDFVPVGHAIRVQIDSPFRLADPQTGPLVTLHASAPNHTASTWELRSDLDPSVICLPAIPNAVTYQLSASSACVKLSPPEPDKFTPRAHPRIDRNPVLKLTVLRVPVYVRFQFDQASVVPAELSSVTRDGSIPVDVGFPGSDQPTETVMANWSRLTKSQQPFAEAVVWLNPNHQTITLQPRPAPRQSDQWHYTYMLRDADPVNVTLPLATDDHQQRRSPDNQTSSTNPCDLFSGQTVLFGLDVGLVLRGQIQPPVDKVEVSLFMQSPHTDDGPGLVGRPPGVGLLFPQTESDPKTEALNEPPSEHTVDPLVMKPLATTRSDSHGVFTFSEPVRVPVTAFGRIKNPNELFHVRLSKPGFDFTELSGRTGVNNWLFNATKLSLVEVVIYETTAATDNLGRTPLEGVLVSIIGEGHRGNLFTDQSGVANFVGLAPGQYYVRAMMKEYTFHVRLPSSSEPSDQPRPILVQAGVAVRVEIVATRVAYSASGLVRSLGGTPLASVTVEAQLIAAPPPGAKLRGNASASSNCESVTEHIPHEQSLTDMDGRFRIRGLLPGCYYAISVLPTKTDSLASSLPCQVAQRPPGSTTPSVHHAVPAVTYIRQPNQDLDGLAFLAMPQLFLSTFTVDVDTEPEFIPYLRLILFPLDRPDLVLMRHEFSQSLLFTVPGSKMCQLIGREIVTRLENTLDPQIFHNIGPQQVVLRPQLDVSKHHTFTFRPRLRSASSHTYRSDL